MHAQVQALPLPPQEAERKLVAKATGGVRINSVEILAVAL